MVCLAEHNRVNLSLPGKDTKRDRDIETKRVYSFLSYNNGVKLFLETHENAVDLQFGSNSLPAVLPVAAPWH